MPLFFGEQLNSDKFINEINFCGVPISSIEVETMRLMHFESLRAKIIESNLDADSQKEILLILNRERRPQ